MTGEHGESMFKPLSFLCGFLWGLASIVQAADGEQLINLINHYRSSSASCEGQPSLVRGPLSENRLLVVHYDFATSLQQILQSAGYPVAKARAMEVEGGTPVAAMESFKRHYCALLLNPEFTEIGVSRQGNIWQVIVAKPILSRTLGGWQSVGQEVLKYVNEMRAKPRRCGNEVFYAVLPLTWNAKLAEAAWAHSRDMAEHNYLSHQNRNGQSIGERLKQQGYRWGYFGENIASRQSSAQEVVTTWMNSPPHCANIMNPSFMEMGAAYVTNLKSNAAIYWTQIFAAPVQ